MGKIKTALLVILLCTLYSCRTPYNPYATKDAPFKVETYQDKFYPGVTKYYSTSINIKEANLIDPTRVDIQFVRLVSKDTSYNGFVFTYRGRDWIFMKGIRLLIDGKVLDVLPKIDVNRDVINTSVKEVMGIRFNKIEMDSIINAKNVDIHIFSEERNYDFNFNQNLREKLYEFLLSCNNPIQEMGSSEGVK